MGSALSNLEQCIGRLTSIIVMVKIQEMLEIRPIFVLSFFHFLSAQGFGREVCNLFFSIYVIYIEMFFLVRFPYVIILNFNMFGGFERLVISDLTNC